ncbi:hypothetical protein CRENBAI_012678 [Crenichthys baileyi]|uniref:Neuropeptide gamma n=1 Tax=Crenichthys baileyi TaxID=28760 RepID=A0AAV9S185_9TELE
MNSLSSRDDFLIASLNPLPPQDYLLIAHLNPEESEAVLTGGRTRQEVGAEAERAESFGETGSGNQRSDSRTRARYGLNSVELRRAARAPIFCEDGDPKEGADYWTSSNQIQDDWLSNDPFREILLRMTRKPRPHQFIGLMGKRSMANAQITRKRHKLNSFVGLMGKRSQEEPESYEWSTIQMNDQRR